jgi:hypothetical protein
MQSPGIGFLYAPECPAGSTFDIGYWKRSAEIANRRASARPGHHPANETVFQRIGIRFGDQSVKAVMPVLIFDGVVERRSRSSPRNVASDRSTLTRPDIVEGDLNRKSNTCETAWVFHKIDYAILCEA